MIIYNKTKSVIVLKAVGLSNLRLFPGHNTVDGDGLDKYFQSKAAAAHQKINLSVVKSGDLSPEERKMADGAEKKNTRLNKAQRVVKAQNETLAQNDETISNQAQLLKDQDASIKELQTMIKKLEETVTEKDKKKTKK